MGKQISYVGAGRFSLRKAHDIPTFEITETDESDSKIQTPQNYSLPKTFYQRYPNWNTLKLKLGLTQKIE